MTRKRSSAKPPDNAPTLIQPPEAVPVQREASPEEQAQIQAEVQRQRTSVAVLKQRFAEADVAMTIAQGECRQLIQQNQILQEENVALKAEIAALKNPKKVKTPTEKPDEHVPQHQ